MRVDPLFAQPTLIFNGRREVAGRHEVKPRMLNMERVVLARLRMMKRLRLSRNIVVMVTEGVMTFRCSYD